MKKPKVPEVKLPYASTVASFSNDQGAGPPSSFLGRLFANAGARQVITASGAPKPRGTAMFSKPMGGTGGGNPVGGDMGGTMR